MGVEVLEDAVFGTLTWDAELGWWAGRAELSPGYGLRVYIESVVEAGEARGEDLERARSLWAVLCGTERTLRLKAAEEMFWGMYCDWRQGVDPPAPELDLHGFVEAFRLQSVTFWGEEGAELYLDDALEVFGGHVPRFCVDEHGNFEPGSAAL